MVQNDEQAVDERAEKITKYLALATSLRTDSSESDYRLANSLAWELALWMPTDFYRLMGQALCKPALFNDFIIAVRRGELKGQAGDLGPQDIIHHAPGIGLRKNPGLIIA